VLFLASIFNLFLDWKSNYKLDLCLYTSSIDLESLSEKDKIDLVLSGQMHLVEIKVSSEFKYIEDDEPYTDLVNGYFCALNWSLHKSNPSSNPMFRDLKQNSNCDTIQLDLKTVVDLAREYDETNDDVHAMSPSGFVFHESRCGSTLVANALAAMDPESTRVYSESGPPVTAVNVCGIDGSSCPKGRALELLRDVIYLMGRTNDEGEEHLFFKIQSIGTKHIEVFLEAFPDTPWIFVYREPVQIMMSQLEHGAKSANCVRQLRDIPPEKIEQIHEMGKGVKTLTSVEKCALHLSLLCESVVKAFAYSINGRAVNYENIVEKLVYHVIPEHFRITMTKERAENIYKISGTYSKGRGQKKHEWKEDSSEKERNASPQIREAADLFLQDLYDELENQSKLQYFYHQDD